MTEELEIEERPDEATAGALTVGEVWDGSVPNLASLTQVWSPLYVPNDGKPRIAVGTVNGRPAMSLTVYGQSNVPSNVTHVRTQCDGRRVIMKPNGQYLIEEFVCLIQGEMPALKTGRPNWGLLIQEPNYSTPYGGPPPISLCTPDGDNFSLQLPSGKKVWETPITFGQWLPLTWQITQASSGKCAVDLNGQQVWSGAITAISSGHYTGYSQMRRNAYMENTSAAKATVHFSGPVGNGPRVTRLA